MRHPRAWRRGLRALALLGRARVVVPGPDGSGSLDLGPAGAALRADASPLRWDLPPVQGRLGDCWLLGAMLAVHGAAPERLEALVRLQPGGMAEVTLPGMSPLLLPRHLPADGRGRFVYARTSVASPGWAGLLELAVAHRIAGGYTMLPRGFARYGLLLLLGRRGRTHLLLPDADRILRWQAEGRAMTASTHPLSGRVRGPHGAFRPAHVYALVGAERSGGHVLLRDPHQPRELLRVDARTFRRAVLSVDVSPPLR